VSEIAILFVEHDTFWIKKVTLESGLNEVSVEPIKDPAEIEKAMLEKRYDLVLADVFWPNPKTRKEEDKRIGEIIENVRRSDSLVPIVVLSQKDDAHQEAMKYVGEIYDIWSKVGGYIDFLPYRIRKLIESRQNELGEQVLLDAVRRTCADNSASWENEICRRFTEEYERCTGTGLMLQRIMELFSELGYKAGLEEIFVEETFEKYARFEPLDMARSWSTWGHLRHSLSVFLAGYVLLNSLDKLFDQANIIKSLRLSDWDSVNKAWFLASAFHDSMSFLQHSPEMLKNIMGAVGNHLVVHNDKGGRKVSPGDLSVALRYSENDYKEIKQLLDQMDRSGLYPELAKYMKSQLDHGVLSGLHLLNARSTQRRCGSDLLNNACFSIILHHAVDKQGIELKQECDFLAQLLCLLDRFQAWGRENHYEGLFDGSCIEKVVLRRFDVRREIKGREVVLSMKTDYLPFRFLSPRDQKLKEKEKELKGIIRRNMDVLQRIELERVGNKTYWRKIELDFSFCLLGRQIEV
jgi:hypothetical protein